MGNAAIAGIEHENQVAEQKQLQASIEKLQATQSAELGASTDAFETQTVQMAMDAINAKAQTTLDQEFAGTEQSLADQLAATPDPSLAASIAAVIGTDSALRGTATVGSPNLFEPNKALAAAPTYPLKSLRSAEDGNAVIDTK